MNAEGVAVLHDVTKVSDAAAPAPALRGVMKVAGAARADMKEVGVQRIVLLWLSAVDKAFRES